MNKPTINVDELPVIPYPDNPAVIKAEQTDDIVVLSWEGRSRRVVFGRELYDTCDWERIPWLLVPVGRVEEPPAVVLERRD